MKKKLALTLAILFLVSFAACSVPGADTETGDASTTTETEKILNMATSGLIACVDPQITNGAGDAVILTACFEGLVTQKDGEIIAGIAESWDISDDNTVYTFYLRDATWSDGVAITAQDFYDSFYRLATEPRAAEQLWYADPILNIAAVSEGTVDASELGIEVVDEKTFRITLSSPTPYFLQLLTHSMFLPIRSDLVEEQGESYGLDSSLLAYNGAFIIEEWEPESKLVLTKNPNYWRADEINLDQVIYYEVPDETARTNMFDVGDIDFLTLSSTVASLYEDNENYVKYDSGGSEWLQFSAIGKTEESGALFANRNFINALSYAIDRTALDEALFDSNYAYGGIINPSITAYGDVKWGEYSPEAETYAPLTSDIEQAKEYLELAIEELGYDSVEDLPTITFTVIDGDFYKTVGEYFQDVFTRELGLDVEVEQLLVSQFYEVLQSGEYDLTMPGWSPDWDDPDTYMSMWHSEHPNNVNALDQSELDAILDAIKTESDQEKRAEMYVEAEYLLVTEGPVIPLHMRTASYVYSDRVEGIIVNMFVPSVDFRWADIIE